MQVFDALARLLAFRLALRLALLLTERPPAMQVFDAVLPVALGLMKDLFGNYVCQKFLERGSEEQREALGTQ